MEWHWQAPPGPRLPPESNRGAPAGSHRNPLLPVVVNGRCQAHRLSELPAVIGLPSRYPTKVVHHLHHGLEQSYLSYMHFTSTYIIPCIHAHSYAIIHLKYCTQLFYFTPSCCP